MKLLDHLNKVAKERGFDSFRHATDGAMTYAVESIIEEAGNRFKNEL